MWGRQRLCVNPKTGLLYVAEGQTTGHKAFRSVLEINPDTGAICEVQLPFDAEDLAFGAAGAVDLSSTFAVFLEAVSLKYLKNRGLASFLNRQRTKLVLKNSARSSRTRRNKHFSALQKWQKSS